MQYITQRITLIKFNKYYYYSETIIFHVFVRSSIDFLFCFEGAYVRGIQNINRMHYSRPFPTTNTTAYLCFVVPGTAGILAPGVTGKLRRFADTGEPRSVPLPITSALSSSFVVGTGNGSYRAARHGKWVTQWLRRW